MNDDTSGTTSKTDPKTDWRVEDALAEIAAALAILKDQYRTKVAMLLARRSHSLAGKRRKGVWGLPQRPDAVLSGSWSGVHRLVGSAVIILAAARPRPCADEACGSRLLARHR
jgi:hypothetical protein